MSDASFKFSNSMWFGFYLIDVVDMLESEPKLLSIPLLLLCGVSNEGGDLISGDGSVEAGVVSMLSLTTVAL